MTETKHNKNPSLMRSSMNKPNLLQRFRNESSRTRSATEPGWRSVYSIWLSRRL